MLNGVEGMVGETALVTREVGTAHPPGAGPGPRRGLARRIHVSRHHDRRRDPQWSSPRSSAGCWSSIPPTPRSTDSYTQRSKKGFR